MRIISTFGFCLLLSYSNLAQDCSCAVNYKWLKETFEKNDAGFQYVIDQKGDEEYKKHCDQFKMRVAAIEDKQECAETLSEWLRFFRDGHIWFGLVNENSSNRIEKIDRSNIQKEFKDWEKFEIKEKEFKSYLSTIHEPTMEGIWSSPPYTIGIKKTGEEYLGFIIEADGIYWSKSQVKLRIKTGEDGGLTATYYMQDHSANEFEKVELLGNNHLRMGFITFKRVGSTYPGDPEIDRHFRFMETQEPIFESISKSVAILRIPSFEHSQKRIIDSLIDLNRDIITSAENLIIDLRYNGGGSDGSFEKILPLIYTNPFRTVGVELLSTPLNNQRMNEFMNDPEWSEEDRKWAEESLEKLNNHLGEFVNLNSSAVTIETLDSVLPHPKKVGIIVNNGCGSTTEQFLLAAKQSQKVKLFGTTTRGVLDISNMHSTLSPCEDFELAYCISRSMRIPEMTIDNIGIQPDYYIDSTISEYKWVDFVSRVLNTAEY